MRWDNIDFYCSIASALSCCFFSSCHPVAVSWFEQKRVRSSCGGSEASQLWQHHCPVYRGGGFRIGNHFCWIVWWFVDNKKGKKIEMGLLKGDVATKRLARLLRGTFHSLLGEHDKALLDYSTVFEDQNAGNKVDWRQSLFFLLLDSLNEIILKSWFS